MAVRIRVYPQYGGYGMYGNGGYGRFGGMYGYGQVAQNRLLKAQVSNQRKTSALQLQYERALWQQRLQMAELQSAARYGGYGGVMSPYALAYGASPALIGTGALMNPYSGGLGMLGMGAGQANITNQVSLGAGAQSVSNSNVSNRTHRMVSPMMSGWGGYPGGWW